MALVYILFERIVNIVCAYNSKQGNMYAVTPRGKILDLFVQHQLVSQYMDIVYISITYREDQHAGSS